MNIYKECPWDYEQFGKKIWRTPYSYSHKEFLDQLALALNIKSMEEWYNITKERLLFGDDSAVGFLDEYEGSLEKALQAVYPEYPWDIEKFIKYQDIENLKSQR